MYKIEEEVKERRNNFLFFCIKYDKIIILETNKNPLCIIIFLTTTALFENHWFKFNISLIGRNNAYIIREK